MKGRVIALSVISLLLISVGVALAVNVSTVINTQYFGNDSNYLLELENKANAYLGLVWTMVVLYIASFVLGIVTLSMDKEPVRGLGIAMGVCGIVVPGVNIILGIIATVKLYRG